MPRTRAHPWVLLGLLGLVLGTAPAAPAAPAAAGEPPVWMPRYDLDIQLHLDEHHATVRQQVTWINYHQRPASELVFNVHSRYKIPAGSVGPLAKMLEILRMNPDEALDTIGRACEVQKVTLVATPETFDPERLAAIKKEGGPEMLPPPRPVQPGPPLPTSPAPLDLAFHYREDNDTALVVPLPHPVGPGEAVTVVLDVHMRLPQKQGRWGQWKGVTALSNWLPVLAFYEECGWQPTPFIPWHQPFYNEAGVYRARVTLPCDQVYAGTGSVIADKELGNGLRQVELFVCGARDFAFLCSNRFVEFTKQAGPVRVRCLAFPEHAHYAQVMVQSACDAIPTYCRWFGPYPYPDFNIVEAYFGWNGNECSGLIMIDNRIFGLPHLAEPYVDYLVAHETCHQWWYNIVGTNGYCETWMDEGLATYFSYRHIQQKCGNKQGKLLSFPRGWEWLPNIDRETYRHYGMIGTMRRGEACPTVQDIPKFSHLVNLLSMTYDRGGKIVGIIEDRLGEAAFCDFMKRVHHHYRFRVLRVADFQRELEEYTGRSWEQFFKEWLYGAGASDWCVDKVQVTKSPAALAEPCVTPCDGVGPRAAQPGPYKVTVLLSQKAEINDQTVLGFSLDGSDNYQIRVPIQPQVPVLDLDEPPGRIEMLPENRVRVEVLLPCKPTQIAVDPDRVLVDSHPSNNYWKTKVNLRLTPVYTALEETDLTAAYDRWNLIAGPWVYGSAYADPWYQRSNMIGVRAGVYKTQEFSGGTYLAYRQDYQDIAAGVDGVLDHWPWSRTQIGFNAERGLTSSSNDDRITSRATIYGRYIFQYTASLYMPPMEYVEAFGSILENPLPLPRNPVPGSVDVDHQTQLGLHYRRDYLTPYWNPEGGYRFDITTAAGLPYLGPADPFYRVNSQLSFVKGLPDGLGWLSETRLAARLYGAAGLPDQGNYFSLGGSTLYRGFDMRERQGSMMWIGSLEWRVPLVRGVTWDTCDHCAGIRNVWAAAFYDAGEIFVKGDSVGGVAHALGGGLRLDVAWFSFIERTTLRIDVAKTVNDNTPVQVWLGVMLPF